MIKSNGMSLGCCVLYVLESYLSLIFISMIVILWSGLLAAKQGYYRFPSLHGDTVVFTAEGDLWQVSVSGGMACRLTSHHGSKTHAQISPDGSTIAFAAESDRVNELYTMPLSGGVPQRQTWHGILNVSGWTPRGRVLYCSSHFSTLPNFQLLELEPASSRFDRLPLEQAVNGVYNSTEDRLYFTRLPFQGSSTKRYKGGLIEQIWVFNQATDKEAKCLTSNYSGISRAPMFWEQRVYFASDRDGTMNIWSMDESGENLKQHTFHKGWDIQSPSLNQGRIVYQLGADIYLLSIESGGIKKLTIDLMSDFDQLREKWVHNPMKYLTFMDISPVGDQIALTSRGRVFVLPIKNGRLVEATRQQGIRFYNGQFMPDGKKLLLQSDQTGEVEFCTVSADGIGPLQNLNNDAATLTNPGVPSPDGRWVTYTDLNNRLWRLNLASRKKQLIDQSDVARLYTILPPHGDDVLGSRMFNMSWSPDSAWLAYTKLADNGYARIMLYSMEQQKSFAVTSDRAYSFSPSWSKDGNWLYFLSERHFESIVDNPWGAHQPEPYFANKVKVFQLALRTGLQSPFKLVHELNRYPEANKSTKKQSTEKERRRAIELDGIAQRLFEVPVKPGRYINIKVGTDYLYLVNREENQKYGNQLLSVKIENQHSPDTQCLASQFGGHTFAANSRSILFNGKEGLYFMELSDGDSPSKKEHKIDLSRWRLSVYPRDEWRQMLTDAWRMERDLFYDPAMHGNDWKKVLERHLPLVERVTDRDELDDLMEHMLSELGALHTFVYTGDKRWNNGCVAMGFLGAELNRDEKGGGYRVKKVYQGVPENPKRLSPLQKPDVNVVEGDVIEAVNGVSTLSVRDIGELLDGKAGQQVRLLIQTRERIKREVMVEPFSRNQVWNLRYDDWELSRRAIVEESSQDDIGYIHLRAMNGEAIAQWARDYYPVFDRKGLILDIRHNKGGNIDSWILEKLMRKPWFFWKARTGKPYWSMQYAFNGHLVLLCNENTYSNGETLTEGVRQLGLGKVIGTRTWGGSIWITSDNPLVDDGIAIVPRSGTYDRMGNWLIEGHGVEPDITIDNLPHETFNGKDAQLEAAIQYLKEKIAAEPVEVPEAPPYPVKAFDYGN